MQYARSLYDSGNYKSLIRFPRPPAFDKQTVVIYASGDQGPGLLNWEWNQAEIGALIHNELAETTTDHEEKCHQVLDFYEDYHDKMNDSVVSSFSDA